MRFPAQLSPLHLGILAIHTSCVLLDHAFSCDTVAGVTFPDETNTALKGGRAGKGDVRSNSHDSGPGFRGSGFLQGVRG